MSTICYCAGHTDLIPHSWMMMSELAWHRKERWNVLKKKHREMEDRVDLLWRQSGNSRTQERYSRMTACLPCSTKGPVIIYVEGEGRGEKNVGHAKLSMWPPHYDMHIASDPPPLPLPCIYWLDVYKASDNWKLTITCNVIRWFLLWLLNLFNYKINVLCKPVSSFSSTSCGLYKQCYCALFINSHVEDTTNLMAWNYFNIRVSVF